MKLFFTKIFCCVIFLFASCSLMAQTKFIASISPENAAKDEYITLKLKVENGKNVQKITPPNFKDFVVISGPNQEQSMVDNNGDVTMSISLTYILKAKKPGEYVFNNITALVDGQTYKSNNIKLKVSNREAGAKQQQQNTNPLSVIDLFEEPKQQNQFTDYILRKGETVPDKVAKNMQLKLQTDKTSCYVGEPIVATYKLFTRLPTESSISKNPSFNGFSVIDLQEQVDPFSNKQEVLNGREYNTYTLRKTQLYPLQAGATELESASLENKITFVKYESGSGNDGSAFNENVLLSSKPITINVKPLPDAGKPELFGGAVGDFDFEVSVAKSNFSTDENGVLRIIISGKGNMHLLTLPEIQWEPSFEAFEPKITDNLNNNTIPISGSKIFEIPFAVSKEGTFKIPALSFSFFNPVTASYKTITSKEIPLTITKGTGKKVNYNTPTIKKDKNIISTIFEKRWLLISIIAFVIMTGLFFWQKKEKKNNLKAINETLKAEPEIFIPTPISLNKNYLEKTSQCLHTDDCIDFYRLLNQELKNFLSDRLIIGKENVNTKTLSNEMDKAGISNYLSLQTSQLLQEIEWQLYTPFERNEKMYEYYAKAQTLIQALQIKS